MKGESASTCSRAWPYSTASSRESPYLKRWWPQRDSNPCFSFEGICPLGVLVRSRLASASLSDEFRRSVAQDRGARDRQAHRLVRDRDAHGHLTVVLFAQDAAILPGHPHRVLAFLGKGGVVDDPRGHAAVARHPLEHPLPRHAQHGGGVPGRVGDEMMHRLMARLDVAGIDARRHRLDALALPRQAEAGDVGAQGVMAIPMAEGCGQAVHIGGEALGTSRLGDGHTASLAAYPMNSIIFLTQSYY